MSAPNRKADVKAAFAGLTIVPETESDEGRRANLYAVGRYLNTLDNGQWGVLVKTDQGGKVPADILVWKDTREHFDVITGAGHPTWIEHGVLPKAAWVWKAIPAAAPAEPPADPPGTTTPIPDDQVWHKQLLALAEAVAGCARQVAALEARVVALEARPVPPEFSVRLVDTSEKMWHKHSVMVTEPKR
jgi:hypothetical protein